jgi:hypothetical protein
MRLKSASPICHSAVMADKPNEYFTTLVSKFNLSNGERRTRKDGDVLSFWVPKEVKHKYAQLQGVSGKRFGEHLKEGILKAIEDALKEAS